jgi:hypothetical protein
MYGRVVLDMSPFQELLEQKGIFAETLGWLARR